MSAELSAADFAAEINPEHERAFGKAREALEHARRAGELLLKAKAAIGHGAWLSWVAEHCDFSARQAQRYMSLAETWPALKAKYDTASHLTLTGALRLLERRESSEVDKARALGARADELVREVRISERILNRPDATLDEVAWVARCAGRAVVELGELKERAAREAGRLLIEVKSLTTGLSDSVLLAMLNDGSLMQACEERIAELNFQAAA